MISFMLSKKFNVLCTFDDFGTSNARVVVEAVFESKNSRYLPNMIFHKKDIVFYACWTLEELLLVKRQGVIRTGRTAPGVIRISLVY